MQQFNSSELENQTEYDLVNYYQLYTSTMTKTVLSDHKSMKIAEQHIAKFDTTSLSANNNTFKNQI